MLCKCSNHFKTFLMFTRNSHYTALLPGLATSNVLGVSNYTCMDLELFNEIEKLKME